MTFLYSLVTFFVSQLGRYFWHVQIRIHAGKMTALSSFRIRCLHVIKLAT